MIGVSLFSFMFFLLLYLRRIFQKSSLALLIHSLFRMEAYVKINKGGSCCGIERGPFDSSLHLQAFLMENLMNLAGREESLQRT
jgi:hypothetical protein